MKRPVWFGYGLISLFLLQAACGGAAGGNMKEQTEVILAKEDNGKEIAVKSGQVIQIQLEARGGTGYWWYVQDLDRRHLEFLSEKTRAGDSGGRVGAPVLGIWTFRARDPGVSEIRMAYYRIWEGSAGAADRFSVRIRIE